MLPGGFPPTVSTVSIALIAHGATPYLAETIGSVLAQTERDWELLVLDDSGSDRAAALVRGSADPRIRVERVQPLPEPANLDRAVRRCRGSLVKVLHEGDLLHPRCLELQVQPLLDDPGLALAAARRHVVDEQSRMIVPRRGLTGLVGIHSAAEVARKIVRTRTNLIGEPCNVVFRLEDYLAVGGWRRRRAHLSDLDLWLRLLQRGDCLGQPEPLAAVRIGPDPGPDGYAERVLAERAAITAELGDLQARALDVAIGRALVPVAGVRKLALSAVSSLSARRRSRELARAQR